MYTQNYNTFWQRMHKSARDKSFPLRVMFELTYRCNFYCKHCYVPQSYQKKKGELKTKEVFSVLEQLKEMGCFYLGFTGGEPFVRKDIIDILWYAKRCGFEVIIYTNGSLIDEKAADELATLRPNKVDITIPAMSKDAFERISGVVGSRNRVFRTIELLHKRGVNLGFKSCVLKDNEREIKRIQDFAASLGALHRLDDMLSPRLDGSREPFRYRGTLRENSASRLTPHASRQTINNCDSKDYDVKTMDYGLSTVDLFKCGVGQTQAAITPLGELKMCLMIDYPKYKIICAPRRTLHAARQKREACSLQPEAYNLKDAWKSLKELVKNITPDENYRCYKCKLEPFCKWCPAKSWLYNETFTSCEPERRYQAELMIRRSSRL